MRTITAAHALTAQITMEMEMGIRMAMEMATETTTAKGTGMGITAMVGAIGMATTTTKAMEAEVTTETTIGEVMEMETTTIKAMEMETIGEAVGMETTRISSAHNLLASSQQLSFAIALDRPAAEHTLYNLEDCLLSLKIRCAIVQCPTC